MSQFNNCKINQLSGCQTEFQCCLMEAGDWDLKLSRLALKYYTIIHLICMWLLVFFSCFLKCLRYY